jgi:copper homeostasis protein
VTLEIIGTSVEDAMEAARGGAHRREVVRDLSRDGFTPSIDLVRSIQRDVPLPLRVMVRESERVRCRSDEERRMLADRAAGFAAHLLSAVAPREAGPHRQTRG